MREVRALTMVAWRDLRLAPLLLLLLGASGLALGRAWPALGEFLLLDSSPARWPIILVALLYGVVAVGGTQSGRAHWLARPVGRVATLAVRLVVLCALVLAAGLVINVAAIGLDTGASLLDPGSVYTLGIAVLCGALAGCLLEDVAPAFGLALLIVFVAALGSLILRIITVRMVVGFGAGTAHLILFVTGALVLGTVVFWHWMRWAPLSTPRATLQLLAWLAVCALLVPAVVLLAPLLVASEPGRGQLVAVYGQMADRTLLVGRGYRHFQDALLAERAGESRTLRAWRMENVWLHRVRRFVGRVRLVEGSLTLMDHWTRPGAVRLSPDGAGVAVLSYGRGTRQVDLIRDSVILGTLSVGDADLGIWSATGDRFAQLVKTSDNGSRLVVVRAEPDLPTLTEASLTDRGKPRLVGWCGDTLLVAGGDIYRAHEQPPPLRLLHSDGRIEASAQMGSLGRRTAVSSPDGCLVAWMEWNNGGPDKVLVVFDLRLRKRRVHALPRGLRRTLGWLDSEHVAVSGQAAGQTPRFAVLQIDGTLVADVRLTKGDVEVREVAGPAAGPWLVLTRHSEAVVAIDRSGRVLWRRGRSDVQADLRRKLVTTDSEVVGVDDEGRLWRRPLPWLEAQEP